MLPIDKDISLGIEIQFLFPKTTTPILRAVSPATSSSTRPAKLTYFPSIGFCEKNPKVLFPRSCSPLEAKPSLDSYATIIRSWSLMYKTFSHILVYTLLHEYTQNANCCVPRGWIQPMKSTVTFSHDFSRGLPL